MAFDKSPDVRFGVPYDNERIFELMKLARDEQGEHPINEDKVRWRIATATERQGALVGVVGSPCGNLMGYVLLVIDPIWYSDEFQLLEVSTFVHPFHRKSTYAKQLINFAKSCADDLDLHLVIGVLSNIRTEAKCRLYRRQVTPIGQFFIHRPGDAHSGGH